MTADHPVRTRLALAASLAALLLASVVFQPHVSSQAPETQAQRAERFRQMSVSAEAKGLALQLWAITALTRG